MDIVDAWWIKGEFSNSMEKEALIAISEFD